LADIAISTIGVCNTAFLAFTGIAVFTYFAICISFTFGIGVGALFAFTIFAEFIGFAVAVADASGGSDLFAFAIFAEFIGFAVAVAGASGRSWIIGITITFFAFARWLDTFAIIVCFAFSATYLIYITSFTSGTIPVVTTLSGNAHIRNYTLSAMTDHTFWTLITANTGITRFATASAGITRPTA
jgi:hypothetical protein